MATKTRVDAPDAPPAFVFKGAVKKMRSATMKEVPVGNRTAVVHVEQVLEAPKSFAHYEGQDITVELAGTLKVTAGEELIFHANSWIFGDSVAVRSVSQERVTKAHSALLTRGGDPTANRRVRQIQERVDSADLIVSGTVAAVTVPPSETAEHLRGAAAPPAMPVSEHDPKWRQAVIQVDQTHKGSLKSRQVTVLFPASTDVRWYKAPKFQAGQKGLFVLHKTKIGTKEHPELRRLAARAVPGKGDVYTAMNPNDVQTLSQQGVIKSMIR
jgi:hypothetical protein